MSFYAIKGASPNAIKCHSLLLGIVFDTYDCVGGLLFVCFCSLFVVGYRFDTYEVGGFSPYMLGMIFNTREGGGLSFVWLFSLFAVGCRFQHP